MVQWVVKFTTTFHFFFLHVVFVINHGSIDAQLDINDKNFHNYTLQPTLFNSSIDEETAECYLLMQRFAIKSSAFTRCAVEYARPIRFCQHCIKEKEDVRKSYAEMGKWMCNGIIFNADRIEIVDTVYAQNKALWQNANCDNCYNFLPNNTFNLKNTTAQFLSLVNETQTCFVNMNITVCPLGKNDTYCPNTACFNCSTLYHNLSKVYEHFLFHDDFPDLCMDITDAMNITRKMWSNDLDCIHYSDDVFVLFTIIAFVCLFPIVFYLGHWIQSDKQKSNIIKQSRLSTTREDAQLTGENSNY